MLVEDCRIGLPLKEIAALLKECAYFITVDSFLQHLAQHVGRAGVVLWSKSDPLIFGYPENLNLLKDRRCLRRQQFRIWEEESYDPDTFLPVGDVVQRIGAWRAMALPVRVAA